MRKLFSLFAALTLSVGLWAETVAYRYPTYIDGDVTKGIDMWQTSSKEAAPVTSTSSTWGAAGQETWLVVNEDVTISQRVTCNGDVRLILADGAKLNATQGITVSGEGNSLTIYAQTEDITQMGKLIAGATNLIDAAGIGGGANGSGSNITINGGIVEATSGGGGAGIGGGDMGSGSNITINGGMVTAKGVNYAAGIGGGNEYEGNVASNIYISDAYILKAGTSVTLTDADIKAHSSATDLASTLTQPYVKIEGLATPYTRSMTIDNWATVCLPYAATSFEGADFYKVNYYDASDPSDLKLYIEPVDNLVAGMPYIFQATADVVTINHSATAPEAVTAGYEGRGLYGSFARKTIAYDGAYAYAAIANNAVNVVEEGYNITIPACRAYLDMDEVPTVEQPHNAPLRCMGAPRGQATGELRIENGELRMNGKFLRNGQLIIVREGKMFNAQGMEVK